MPRKEVPLEPDEPYAARLQWGLGVDAEEGRLSSNISASFNGALASMPRKATLPVPAGRCGWVASTGPRRRCRGRQSANAVKTFAALPQRGLGVDAEEGRIANSHPLRRACFNGASAS